MGELVFRCPACGFAHKVDGARVPAAGIRGACRGCSSPLTVYPDGRVEGQAPPAPPPAPATDQTLLARPTPPAPPPPVVEARRPGAEPLSQMEEPAAQPPTPGLIPFRCPYCGASAERPREEIAPSGTRSVCGTCVQYFLLFPDGRTVEVEEDGAGEVGEVRPAAPAAAVSPEAPARQVLLFACPFCGAPLERDVGGMSPGGMEVACAVCVQLFRIFPDGRVQEPPAETGGWSAPEPAAEPSPAAPPAPAPVDPGTLLFRCPVCGKEIRLPREKVPAAGARGKCSGCQTRLMLHPDGTAVEASKAAPAGDLTRWYYRFGTDELGPFSLAEVGELVRSKAVQAQTPLKPAGGEWGGAASFAALAPFFAASAPRAAAEKAPEKPREEPGTGEGVSPEGPLGDADHCYAHAGAMPVRSCASCLRYLCEACVVEKQVAGVLKPLRLCAACGGSAVALPHRVGWTPFHLDLPNVLRVPLRGHALLYLGLLAFLDVLQVPVAMFGFFGVLILGAFQWAYLLHVTREVANGSYEMPSWPDMGDFSEVFFRFIKVVFVTVVALLPVLIVFCFIGAAAASAALAGTSAGAGALLSGTGLLLLVGAVVAAFFYLFYLPMCIGIVAVFDTVLPALNPVIIFRVMRRIGLPWALAALLWFALLVFDVGFASASKLLPIVGVLLSSVVSAYCMLLFSYTLGRVFAENDHRIGWR